MDDEDTRELHELMRRSVDHVRPQVAELEVAAREDGRRMLQARRRKDAASALTAAAVLAIALSLGLRGDLVGGHRDHSGAPTPAMPVAAGGGDASQTVDDPSSVPSGSARFRVPGLLSAIEGPKSLLPDGAVQTGSISTTGGLVAGRGSAAAFSRILRPGVGAGTMRVSEKFDAPPISCPRAATGVVCRVLTGTGGRQVGTATSTTYGALKVRSVVIQMPTGRRQAIAVANTDSQTWGPQTLALDTSPPLTLDELIIIAAEATNTALSRS